MMNILQMLLNQKIQQIPNGMMKQLENQLKRVNPQAFKEYQEAKQNKMDPNEYLNKITSGFDPQMKQQWDSMMSGINSQKN